jgi:hypothetical protein
LEVKKMKSLRIVLAITLIISSLLIASPQNAYAETKVPMSKASDEFTVEILGSIEHVLYRYEVSYSINPIAIIGDNGVTVDFQDSWFSVKNTSEYEAPSLKIVVVPGSQQADEVHDLKIFDQLTYTRSHRSESSTSYDSVPYLSGFVNRAWGIGDGTIPSETLQEGESEEYAVVADASVSWGASDEEYIRTVCGDIVWAVLPYETNGEGMNHILPSRVLSGIWGYEEDISGATAGDDHDIVIFNDLVAAANGVSKPKDSDNGKNSYSISYTPEGAEKGI